MKDFEKTLNQLIEFVQAYDDTSPNDGDALNYLLKKITNSVFYLESERYKFHKEYQQKIYSYTVDKKMTVARAVNFAENEVPELYLLRRITETGIRVCDAIRTNISYLKSEKNQVKG